jgi:predicted  nucleic acid-binding Zn-ribbon protein
MLKSQAAAPVEAVSKAEAPVSAPSADIQALQAELQTVKEQAASKDQEVNELRARLQTLETNQSNTLASLREQLNRLEGRKPIDPE